MKRDVLPTLLDIGDRRAGQTDEAPEPFLNSCPHVVHDAVELSFPKALYRRSYVPSFMKQSLAIQRPSVNIANRWQYKQSTVGVVDICQSNSW